MKVLITGGAGFIGTNVALAFAAEGHEVDVVDNFSRTEANRHLLESSRHIRVHEDDVTVADFLRYLCGTELVVHAAAQAAVTHSLVDPLEDFYDNGLGTLNLLEACRGLPFPPHVVYLSTNKVYGPLLGNTSPVSEASPLDPCTPYGCSKAVGDIYVRDYARIFNLPTTVFRMSCIYGGHQYGDTHQGWAAHFMRAALAGDEIVVYGDGEQVRDLLHVDDLIRAIKAAHADVESGDRVFNLGGGPARAISVNGLLAWIRAQGVEPVVRYESSPRAGDQHFYVSDCEKFGAATGWVPEVRLEDGLRRLWDWCVSVRG